jgi:hypothetical protein
MKSIRRPDRNAGGPVTGLRPRRDSRWRMMMDSCLRGRRKRSRVCRRRLNPSWRPNGLRISPLLWTFLRYIQASNCAYVDSCCVERPIPAFPPAKTDSSANKGYANSNKNTSNRDQRHCSRAPSLRHPNHPTESRLATTS